MILLVIMGADTDKPFTNRTIKMNKSNRYWLNTKYLIVILTVILILVIYLYTSREIDNYKWREPNEEQGTGGEKHQQAFEMVSKCMSGYNAGNNMFHYQRLQASNECRKLFYYIRSSGF